ncbi:hypothetical protein IT6_09495 [Methylacidiphilum caldifontis]|uniref:hypothetical protein n=1 Tax=Methylacidiphilum caldifontis TaxID=2795386 RepID=UPI001A8E3BA2|nr:hypothetical protein [Methylacidiphilum caldifontis]QSR88583.1 hypothetical protein IT6_09495 [Methylacidiphilum caldifontis]
MLEPLPIECFPEILNKSSAYDELKSLLDKWGSDKANVHKYHYIYGPIFDILPNDLTIMEFGIGTTNKNIASNMGKKGKPGASLRAFSEYRPKANIYGADIDRKIMFEDKNIKTYHVDQTNLLPFQELENNIKNEFHLIIDDGLHSPNANLATLLYALKKLTPG